MKLHDCIYADGYRIPCSCSRGLNHGQEAYDVPVDDPDVDAAIEAALNDPSKQPYAHGPRSWEHEEDIQPSRFIDTRDSDYGSGPVYVGRQSDRKAT